MLSTIAWMCDGGGSIRRETISAVSKFSDMPTPGLYFLSPLTTYTLTGWEGLDKVLTDPTTVRLVPSEVKS
jgi:hypothetical protein